MIYKIDPIFSLPEVGCSPKSTVLAPALNKSIQIALNCFTASIKSKENNSEETESRREIRIMVDPVRDSSQQKQDPSEGYNSLKN